MDPPIGNIPITYAIYKLEAQTSDLRFRVRGHSYYEASVGGPTDFLKPGHDVVGFDVSVRDTVPVAVGHGAEQLPRKAIHS